ncbi:hypothetical protein BJP36_39820 [Moorena producens JHB]|uniref:Uncharacterized protein n=1 Tax=Moorena producens (strain JHB) TaxID=1454205 RepID=A0A9Q9UWS7_MOOP1|nr:hypothetical protein [Moorena producens]WAN70205.1 hypothetical protein BJP36_39820 [Moorena producens JHB]
MAATFKSAEGDEHQHIYGAVGEQGKILWPQPSDKPGFSVDKSPVSPAG